MLSSLILPVFIFLSRFTPALQRACPVCPGDSGVETRKVAWKCDSKQLPLPLPLLFSC